MIAYRFAVELTAMEEAARIGRVGGRQGRTERYIAADIPIVYEGGNGVEIEATMLDPMLRKSKG